MPLFRYKLSALIKQDSQNGKLEGSIRSKPSLLRRSYLYDIDTYIQSKKLFPDSPLYSDQIIFWPG